MTVLRVVLLILFAGIMAWLWHPILTEKKDDSVKQEEHLAKPDYIATQLQQLAYSENGQLNYQVKANKMEVFQELGFSHFTQPVFTLYNGEQNWELSAAEATLYDNNMLVLEGNVLAKNLTEGAMISDVFADNVRVDIKQKLMNSQQPVEIIGPSLKITGKGLTADLHNEVIELINHTKTIYYDQ
ncbi:LPS export ABC transporter periplasmic protein LptC [Pseudoalteromonas sp. T1lg65]|uniref:LPS export ABC transporter periplasmic protein LptC n=1 Tax=Pseudoalteromonas sp. T1lg65 TaxID=2077101 RepID=UPI003F79CA75